MPQPDRRATLEFARYLPTPPHTTPGLLDGGVVSKKSSQIGRRAPRLCAG
jgi:hypothetical protein